MEHLNELTKAIEAGLLAKEKIMYYYNHGFHVEIKSDDSPVTEADKQADKIIKEYLSKNFPDYGFLTEESDDNLDRLNKEYIWIIDPVDGTKDFVKRDGEFTTNIALCKNHEVILGVVVIPSKNIYYYALKGEGAYKVDLNNNTKVKIHVSNKTSDLTCLRSVFHFSDAEKEMITKHHDKIKHIEAAGSSLKACLIAEGKAEISYRLSAGTKEWDTAAFQIIVEEAGGLVLKPNKERMTYNREDVYNREGYLIINNIDNFLL